MTTMQQYMQTRRTRPVASQARAPFLPRNISRAERILSTAAGAVLSLAGGRRNDSAGWTVAALGGILVARGISGHCPAYGALGVDHSETSAKPAREEPRGVHISQSMLIDKTPEELYAFWRNFENLPRIMTHLKSVTNLDDRRSHWVVKAPALVGGEMEWDAELVTDQPNSRIEWRSLPDSEIEHHGSVVFSQAPGTRGTGVRIELRYVPPAGQIGRWIAKLFGEEPEQQIWDDLRNFKRYMEVGEVPTIEGQPRGSCLKLSSWLPTR